LGRAVIEAVGPNSPKPNSYLGFGVVFFFLSKLLYVYKYALPLLKNPLLISSPSKIKIKKHSSI